MGMDPISLAALASLGGNIIQSNVAKDTAGRQGDALRSSNQLAQGQYNTAIGSYEPYGQAGAKALQSYQDLLGGGSFGNNPQFQYQQQLLNQRLAKSRQSTSASAQSVYSQPLIAGGYQSALSNLMPLISGGMSATGAQAGLRQGLAGLISGQGTNDANAIGAAMPHYDTMIGNAIGTYTGMQNAGSQNNYMNALASYYTNGNKTQGQPSALFSGGFDAPGMSTNPYGPVNKTMNWGY